MGLHPFIVCNNDDSPTNSVTIKWYDTSHFTLLPHQDRMYNQNGINDSLVLAVKLYQTCSHTHHIIMLMDFSFHNFSYQLSDEDNWNLFGKCNNPNGHGHNYKGKISWQIFITTMTLRVLYIGMFYFIICLKGKRGFGIDFFTKCVPSLHAWLYIFPKHDLIIQQQFEFIWALICDT